jgi:5-methylcytosine-specific restriction endonuclease McrA
MKQWIQSVMKKDNYTCILCGQVGGKLCVHHIFPFGAIVESYMRFHGNLEYAGLLEYAPFWNECNGVTLCKKCHAQFPNRIADDGEFFVPPKLYERFLMGAQRVVVCPFLDGIEVS